MKLGEFIDKVESKGNITFDRIERKCNEIKTSISYNKHLSINEEELENITEEEVDAIVDFMSISNNDFNFSLELDKDNVSFSYNSSFNSKLINYETRFKVESDNILDAKEITFSIFALNPTELKQIRDFEFTRQGGDIKVTRPCARAEYFLDKGEITDKMNLLLKGSLDRSI